MHRLRLSALWISVFALAAGAFPTAQGKDKLPKGRPFQMLQHSIDEAIAQAAADIEALQTQLATLEGRVDAIEQHDAVQDQLISTMQAAIFLMEQRLSATEASISELETWAAAQDAVIAQIENRINSLQTQINSQGAALNTLFALHTQQQILISQLQGAINFLQGQNNSQQVHLNALQAQLNSVQGAYNQTRNQLALGCPANSSIRQVVPGGPVRCEADTGQFVQTFFASAPFSLGPGQTISRVVVCPVAPPGAPPYVATGGGFSVSSSSVAVLQSMPSAPGVWRVTARNTNPFVSASFAVTAHCVRNAP